jgi:hypothetical protein
MSIVHGSTGLIYFVHEWQPKFNEAALLADREMYAAVSRINHRIQSLAPVLHEPAPVDSATIAPVEADAPIAVMTRRRGGKTYVFAVMMRNRSSRARVALPGLSGTQRVTVLDEDRTLEAVNGSFSDAFAPWDVHLYCLGE